MKLLRICLKREDEEYLEAMKRILHNNCSILSDLGIGFHILIVEEAEKILVNCQFWTHDGYTFEKIDQIIKATSRSLAEFIVEYKEEEICEDILGQEHGVRDLFQRGQLMRYIQLTLGEDEDEGRQRKERHIDWIAERIEKYYWAENHLSMEGFIRFRLKDYWDHWRNVIEHAKEEYLIEKDFSVYIDGLKDIVLKQEAKLDLLHIVHMDDRNLFLFDKNWRRLYSYLVNGISLELEGKKARYEDLIMGAIMTLAPSLLVIHSNQENHQIIYTIKRTFETKVKVCSECKECKRKKS